MILKLKKINFITIKSNCLEDVDTEKVLVSNKISFGEKTYEYFIGYFYNDYKIRPLHIMLPQSSAYVESCDRQTKGIYFLIENNDFLEKYNTIWDKVSAHTCLTVISLDSAFKKDGNYHAQVLVKECKYIEKKVIRTFIDDLESSSDDSEDSKEEEFFL